MGVQLYIICFFSFSFIAVKKIVETVQKIFLVKGLHFWRSNKKLWGEWDEAGLGGGGGGLDYEGEPMRRLELIK